MNLWQYIDTKFKDAFEEGSLSNYKVRGLVLAYCDCINYKELKLEKWEDRNLDFFSIHCWDAKTFVKYFHRVVEGYNNFDGIETPKKIVKVFGQTAKIFPARQGSVCIYVKTKRKIKSIPKAMKTIGCDELHYDTDLDMYRVWFD